MAGGLLQIAATGIQDMVLNSIPEITLFKTIYRRHTNFSIEDIDLQFTGSVEFGRKSSCKLQNCGDLLTNVYLRFEIPKIVIKYIRTLYEELDLIILTYALNVPDNITKYEEEIIVGAIEDILVSINAQIDRYNNDISTIENVDVSDLNTYEVVKFRHRVYDAIMQGDDKYVVYKFLEDMINVYPPDKPKELSTSLQILDTLQTMLYEKIVTDIELQAYDVMNRASTTAQETQTEYYPAESVYITEINTTLTPAQKSTNTFKTYNNIYALNNDKISDIMQLRSMILNDTSNGIIISDILLKNTLVSLDNVNAESQNLFVTAVERPSIPSQVKTAKNLAYTFKTFADIFKTGTSDIKLFERNLLEMFISGCLNTFNANNVRLMDKMYLNNMFKILIDDPASSEYFLYENIYYVDALLVSLLNSLQHSMITFGEYPDGGQRIIDLYNTLHQQLHDYLFRQDVLDIFSTNYPDLIGGSTYIVYMFGNRMPFSRDIILQQYHDVINDAGYLTPEQLQKDMEILDAFYYVCPVEITDVDEFLLNPNFNPQSIYTPPNQYITELKYQMDLYNFIDYVINLVWNGFYNKIFDYQPISQNLILKNIGITSYNHVQGILQIFGGNPFPDYMVLDVTHINNAITYLDAQMTLLETDFTYYNANYQLLNLKTIRLPTELYKYDTYANVTTKIKNDATIMFSWGDTALLDDMITQLEPDILTVGDTYNYLAETYRAGAELGMETAFDDLFSAMTVAYLVSDSDNIMTNFNDFQHYNDYDRFLMAYMIQFSPTNTKYAIKTKMLSTIPDDKALLISVYEKLIAVKTVEKQQYDSLPSYVNYIYTRSEFANFAWVKKLGHYLINEVMLEAEGQVITKMTGEWLEINNELTLYRGHLSGYNKMIGNVEELYSYNNIPKPKKFIYVPIPFWFCKYSGGAIPIVSLIHSNLFIHVTVNEIEKCSYREDDTYFVYSDDVYKSSGIDYTKELPMANQPKLELGCIAVGKYVYLDADERNKFSKQKHEYLIEQVQYNTDCVINSLGSDNVLSTRIFFNNPCKELIWVLQISNNIDGSLTNNEILPYNFGYNKDGSGSIIDDCKIMFNNVVRQNEMMWQYYAYLQQKEHHSNITDTPMYVYSFALHPEDIQPSGSANMSKIDRVDLVMTINDAIAEQIKNGILTATLHVYAVNYNIWRVMSGLCGLAFFD